MVPDRPGGWEPPENAKAKTPRTQISAALPMFPVPQPLAGTFAPIGGYAYRPNGPQEHSPGLSEAMPWVCDFANAIIDPRPEGAREASIVH